MKRSEMLELIKTTIINSCGNIPGSNHEMDYNNIASAVLITIETNGMRPPEPYINDNGPFDHWEPETPKRELTESDRAHIKSWNESQT